MADAPMWRAPASWPVLAAPRLQAIYLCVVELLVLGWVVNEVDRPGATASAWVRGAILVALAVGFEEAAKRAARLRLRLGSDLLQDMTSVWAVAAAVSLPSEVVVCVVVGVLTFVWLRQERPAGRPLYAMLFNTANLIGSALVAAVIFSGIADHLRSAPTALGMSLALVVAVVGFGLVNRVLATGALVAAGLRGPSLLGSKTENLVEFGTLCLGGLVGLAVMQAPWACMLAVVPLFALQRGALVGELEVAAMRDSKTGLLNAVAWEQLAQRELARAARADGALAVGIVDIDRFKLVNDRLGHLAGDDVLRAVGKELEAAVREYDTVGRFGGEEFVVVLPDASVEQAVTIAERIRARIDAMRLRDLVDSELFPAAASAAPPDDDWTLSVSVGLACLDDPGTELNELLSAADGALYRAKARGRNRVVVAERHSGSDDARLPQA